MFGTRFTKIVGFLVVNLVVGLVILSSNTNLIYRDGAFTGSTDVNQKELTGDDIIGVLKGKDTINNRPAGKRTDSNVAEEQEDDGGEVHLQDGPAEVETILFSEEVPKLGNVVGEDTHREALDLALEDSSEIDLTGFFDKNSTPILYHSSGRRLLTHVDFSNLMRGRELHLRKHCQNVVNEIRKNPRQRGLPMVHASAFYVLPSEDLAWCPVYKAASTNWMHNLLYLAKRTDKQIEEIIEQHPRQPNDQARVVAPKVNTKALKAYEKKANAKRLLIVRHPFDRLVSAFRDKLERCHGKEKCTLKENWYYQTYGRSIVSNYRKAATNKYSKDFFSAEKNYGSPLPVEKTWRSAELPTWWEFIQYILETSPTSYDEHWKPVYLYCSICSYSFNYILHFENIQQEETLFAAELTAGDSIHNKWENRNDEGLSKEEIVGLYFNLLSNEEITSLYQIYKQDFLAFGYQFEFRGLKLNMNQ